MRLRATVVICLLAATGACARAPASGAAAPVEAADSSPPHEATGQLPACRRTGCSGELCADEDLMSACVARPEHACYREARCEPQPDGRCGFTRDEALARCLERAVGR